MKRSESESLALSIYNFYVNTADYSIKKTVKHFAQGFKKFTIRRILKRLIERNTPELLPVNKNLPTIRKNEFIDKV